MKPETTPDTETTETSKTARPKMIRTDLGHTTTVGIWADLEIRARSLGYETPNHAVAGLYYDLRSSRMVAAKLGISHRTVINMMKLLDNEILGRGGHNNHTTDKLWDQALAKFYGAKLTKSKTPYDLVTDLRAKGWTFQAIAESTRISRKTIAKALKTTPVPSTQ